LVAVIVLPAIFLVAGAVGVFLAAAVNEPSEASVVGALLLVALVSLDLGGLVLALCVAYLHRLPWRSLISSDLRIDWPRLLIGAGVEGALLLIVLSLAHRFAGAPSRLGTGFGLPLLVPLLLLVPLQSAGEEMLFRGYLTQALGRVVPSRIA